MWNCFHMKTDFQICINVLSKCAEFGAHKLFFVLPLLFFITWGYKISENVFEKCDFLNGRFASFDDQCDKVNWYVAEKCPFFRSFYCLLWLHK